MRYYQITHGVEYEYEDAGEEIYTTLEYARDVVLSCKWIHRYTEISKNHWKCGESYTFITELEVIR